MLNRGFEHCHPGALIEETIEGLKVKTGHNYTQGEISKELGDTRKTLSAITNERQGISPEMSVRLSAAYGTSAEFWLNIQRNYNLWQVECLVERNKVQHFWLVQAANIQPV